MPVSLSKGYAGYAAGTTVQLPTSIEGALIAQGFATTALLANITIGNVTANIMQGTAAIGTGLSSVTITNNLVDQNSVVLAYPVTVDATLTTVRVTHINGSFTIQGNANATANTQIRWKVLVGADGLTNNNASV